MFTQQDKITTQIGATCKYTLYKCRAGRTNMQTNKQNTRKKMKTELLADHVILFFFNNLLNLPKQVAIILINK